MVDVSKIKPNALYTLREVAELTGYSLSAVRNHTKNPVMHILRLPKGKEHLFFLNTVDTMKKKLVKGSEIIRYYSMPVNLPRKKTQSTL